MSVTARSLQRCLSLKTVDGEALRKRLVRRARLIASARPYLRLLSRAANKEGRALVFADKDAVVLETLGDGKSPAARDHRYWAVPVRGLAGTTIAYLSLSIGHSSPALRLGDLVRVAARGLHAQLVANQLREDLHLALAATAREPAASLIERLHQDIVQSYTEARLEIEGAASAVLEERGGLLSDADQAIWRFHGLAQAWRSLLGLPSLESGRQAAVVSDTVCNAMALIEGEARVRGVRLRLSRESTNVAFFGRTQDLVRRVVSLVFRAMELAGAGGLVQLEATKTLSCTAFPSAGPPVHLPPLLTTRSSAVTATTAEALGLGAFVAENASRLRARVGS